MSAELAVLVSLGRHPASGRPRRAISDARALELALNVDGARVEAIHAGNPHEPALREYLGMGCSGLTVSPMLPAEDAVPGLVSCLRALRPAIILAGAAAETGDGSGMVPYLVATMLGLPIAPTALDLRFEADRVLVEQALPAGRRRALSLPSPCVLIVASAAPKPRHPAYAKAMRGRLVVVQGVAEVAHRASTRLERPRRGALRRLTADYVRDTAALAAAPQEVVTGGPREAARAILSFLAREGIQSWRR
jgi:electron transfer flavoprotein beta subunit